MRCFPWLSIQAKHGNYNPEIKTSTTVTYLHIEKNKQRIQSYWSVPPGTTGGALFDNQGYGTTRVNSDLYKTTLYPRRMNMQ